MGFPCWVNCAECRVVNFSVNLVMQSIEIHDIRPAGEASPMSENDVDMDRLTEGRSEQIVRITNDVTFWFRQGNVVRSLRAIGLRSDIKCRGCIASVMQKRQENRHPSWSFPPHVAGSKNVDICQQSRSKRFEQTALRPVTLKFNNSHGVKHTRWEHIPAPIKVIKSCKRIYIWMERTLNWKYVIFGNCNL